MSLAVKMTGVSKRFGRVQALDDVDLEVEAGRIHAVVGENGAGKTTLMKILYGALAPDAGSIEVDGQPRRFETSSEAIEAGIGMVSQHYGIIPELTSLQNLMLGAEPASLIDMASAERRAEGLARQMGFKFDWGGRGEELSPAGAQKLEILKLLWRRARIMILDEPTAMLSPADSDFLFASLQKLVAEGATVLLVTHRLPDVVRFCDSATVLRAGRRIASRPVAEIAVPELARLIVGEDLSATKTPLPQVREDLALRVQDLTALGPRGDEALKAVSLSVRAGEMVGVAGVDGSGQRELVRLLQGLVRPVAGSIELFGADARSMSPADRLLAGLRVVPEDRLAEAVVGEWSLEANAALGLQRHQELCSRGRIRRSHRRELALDIADRFATRHAGIETPMHGLSGGNQQRFVAARALSLRPRLIVAFQPARGLDVLATQALYAAIRSECASGAAALIIAFDLDELLDGCDRLVAMCGGRLLAPPHGQERDREAVGRLMVGIA